MRKIRAAQKTALTQILFGFFSLFFLVVLLRLEVDARLTTLQLCNWSRCAGKRVEAVSGLRECNDLADRLGVRQQGNDAVPAKSDSTVRRSPVGESVQKEPELCLSLFFADAHDLEYTFLDILAVDTN